MSAFGLPSVAHPTSLTVTAAAMQIDQIDSDSRRLFRTVQTLVGLSFRELAAAAGLGKACGAVTNRFYVSRGKPPPEVAHFGPKAITDLGTEQPKPVQSQRPLHCPNLLVRRRPDAQVYVFLVGLQGTGFKQIPRRCRSISPPPMVTVLGLGLSSQPWIM